MKERIIDDNITIPSDNQSAIIAQLRKSPLNLIATFITPHLAAIIVFLLLVVAPVRANQLNTFVTQAFAKPITIVSLVGNQPLRFFPRTALSFTRPRDIVQRFFEQLDLRG